MRTRFEIPQGFSDEILWFRFFPMRSLMVMLALAVPGFFLIKLLSPFGITMYVFIIWFFIEAVVVASTMIPVPVDRWRNGGGVTYDRLAVRILIRKLSRCLYIKGYDQLRYEEELKHELSDREGI